MGVEHSPSSDPETEAKWRAALTGQHPGKLAWLPGNHRCFACQTPLAGVGGAASGMFGYRQSRKSPSLCNYCDDLLPLGGAEVDMAILFADMRGSTALAQKLGPTAFAALLNRFYEAASKVLIDRKAVVDKLVGDEIVAMFLPGSGPDYRKRAVESAMELLKAVGFGKGLDGWAPIGVGVNAGLAYVGKVGANEVNDFTALGDTVNAAARLQSEAEPGEVILSETLYEEIVAFHPTLEQRSLDLRGRDAPMDVRVLRVS